MPDASLTYRPDIDGLRAIAVMSVVLFHADLGVPGGFVGVDVFFVISGFLITHILVRDLREGRFRLADFWQRRARRILPALVPAAAGAILLSVGFLPPNALVSAAKSAVWLGAFASNIFFSNNLDYFSKPAEAEPLLHTWSLAVEEQFYVLFPPLLMLGFALGKRSIKRLFMLVALLAASSLAASLLLTKSHPSQAFYYLHTRAFELLVGALLVSVPKVSIEKLGWIRELVSMAGLALITFACFGFTPETPFPGWHALVPCLGAALVILGNTSTAAVPPTLLGKALAWRPFVFIGLVSYSFYLWHWPPLAIVHYWHFFTDAPAARGALMLAAFVCAVLSWRFVERPFRKPRPGSRGFVVAACSALALGSLLAAGFGIVMGGGQASRVPPQALAWLGASMDPQFAYSTPITRVTSNSLPVIGVDDPDLSLSILVWGDSHAMAVMPMIDTVCRELGRKGFASMSVSTVPVRGYYSWGRYGLNENALPFAEAIFEMIRRNAIRDVVLVAYWASYFEDTPENYAKYGISKDPFADALLRTVKDLRGLGVRVFFQRQPPHYTVRVPEELARRSLFGRAPVTGEVSLDELRIDSEPMRLLERELAKEGVILVDAVAALSTRAGVPIVAAEGKSLYSDNHHLSTEGAARLLPAYRAALAP